MARSLLDSQYQRPALGAAAVRNHRDLRIGHLALATFAAQLRDALGQKSQSVQPSLGELATAGVQRKRTAGSDRLAGVDPVAELPDPAEAHGLNPGHREVGE